MIACWRVFYQIRLALACMLLVCYENVLAAPCDMDKWVCHSKHAEPELKKAKTREHEVGSINDHE